MPEIGLKVKKDLTKTLITDERVRTVLENMERSNREISELTGGLSVEVIEIIKDAERKGLRGSQYDNR